MEGNKDFSIEALIFNYIDEFKFLLFPDESSRVFLDYSKNEIFTLLFIDQKRVVNVTEIAEYINAPLNTATGVINRLEKKMLLQRSRDQIDKRVVKVCLTEQGKAFLEKEKKMLVYYFKKIFEVLTEEEKRMVLEIINKIIKVLKTKPEQKEGQIKKVRRITIE